MRSTPTPRLCTTIARISTRTASDEEVEYAGDHSGGIGEDGFVTWFDSDNLVNTARIDSDPRSSPESDCRGLDRVDDECTSLAGAEVTFTWRFYSNDDGVNGNAGYAGFGIDNIRVDDYTFNDDGTYIETVTGMDAAQKRSLRWGSMTSRADSTG